MENKKELELLKSRIFRLCPETWTKGKAMKIAEEHYYNIINEYKNETKK